MFRIWTSRELNLRSSCQLVVDTLSHIAALKFLNLLLMGAPVLWKLIGNVAVYIRRGFASTGTLLLRD